MFTQFFGNYLLNNGLVSHEQLSAALIAQKTTRMKLGVLAMNSGILTARDVEIVHQKQQQEDKRFGDVMVELGYATPEQVDELFKMQPSGHLLLGQALVDSGALSNAAFEQALTDYKNKNSVSDDDMRNDTEDSVRRVMSDFYGISGKNDRADYVYLLLKNIIRFIGSDFTPLSAEKLTADISGAVMQKMGNCPFAVTAIAADDAASIQFASRFAKEELTAADEYTQACVSEFINLHNGLFAVNVSNEGGAEIKLLPQEYNVTISAADNADALVIPLEFTFGTVRFIIG